MQLSKDEILAAVLELPASERADVLDAVHDSLATVAEPQPMHPAWAEELDRRIRRVDAGEATSIPNRLALDVLGRRA